MSYSLSYAKIIELDNIAKPFCVDCSVCKGREECQTLSQLGGTVRSEFDKHNPYILSEENIPTDIKNNGCWVDITRLLGTVDVALSKRCSGDCKGCKAQCWTWCYRVCQKANNYNDKVYKLMSDFIEKNTK